MNVQLALGTAQFGMPYGSTNQHGQPELDEVRRILSHASVHAPSMIIDTAPSYGISEQRIGEALASTGGTSFKLVTKTKPGGNIRSDLQESLRRLGLSELYGLLDHNASHLLGPDGRQAYWDLLALKREGLVQKIGASVYTGQEIDALLQAFEIDLIQIPLSVLDQRLITSGHLHKLKNLGIEIHARSIFLQGILLAPIWMLPETLRPFEKNVGAFKSRCQSLGIAEAAGALAFVKQQAVDCAIIGSATANEFAEVVEAFRFSCDFGFWEDLSCDDELLLNPALWSPNRVESSGQTKSPNRGE